MMPHNRIPKGFTIEMVHKVTMLINSLPKSNGIHSVLSPREIVTGKKFRCPSIRIGQYVQGHTGGSNSTDQERSVDALYIGRADNGSGHAVFKLNTKQPLSVNRVTIIPTSEATIKTVNDIGEHKSQPEGIEFSDLNGRITLQDFADNDNDDDSNASDADFKIDEEYKDEEKEEIALEEEEGSVGNNDPGSQEDYFQTPIQQHNSSVIHNNEAPSAVINIRTHSNPIVTLINTISPTEKQECDRRKKKDVNDENASVDSNLDDDDILNNNNAKVGVSGMNDAEYDENNSAAPKEPDSDLGPYWSLAQSTQAYVMNTISSYQSQRLSTVTIEA
jgi:hypothetical protein